MHEYRDDYDDNGDAPVQVRKAPHDPGGDDNRDQGGGVKFRVPNFDDVSSKSDDPNKTDAFSKTDVTSGTGPLYK
jgi:hypothetical protein